MAKEKEIELNEEGYYVVDDSIKSEYVFAVSPDEVETTVYQEDAFCFDCEDGARALCKLCNTLDDKSNYVVIKISVQVVK